MEQGKGLAIASMICGIASLATCYAGRGAITAVIVGIVGIILSSVAKKQGYTGKFATLGLIFSIIGIAVGAIVFISCLACYNAFDKAVDGALSDVTEKEIENIFDSLL